MTASAIDSRRIRAAPASPNMRVLIPRLSLHARFEGVSDEPSPLDGRTARRERGRLAAIDAMFELVCEGKAPPSVDDIAARAGVSAASLFRYFDGIADLQRQTFERFVERYLPLFDRPIPTDGSRATRIESLVDARLRFYDEVGPLLALGRRNAATSEVGLAARDLMRSARADQVREALAPELASATPARAADLVAAVDGITSPEVWDVLREFHGRGPQQIRASWRRDVAAVVGAWEGV